MNTKLRIALALGSLAFAAQAAAQVTFYENEAFQGRTFTTTQRVADLGRAGFKGSASSVVVAGNRWEVCDESRFNGNCMVLRPGRYASLESLGLGDRVASARAIQASARVNENRYAPVPPAYSNSMVTFYEHEGFQGRQFATAKEVDNFTTFGFNDRASSVDVVGQRWEVCDDQGYKGNCMVLRPGRYPSLQSMGLNDRVSSVRIVGGRGRIDESRYGPGFVAGPDGTERRDYRRRNQERVYEANVTSVRAVVGTPEQRCWMEKGAVTAPQAKTPNIPGAVIGAVLGGILGHQVGNGSTQTVATVGGAAAGGYIGSKVGGTTPQAQQQPDVQRCENVQSSTPTYYDVGYNFRGQDHRVQMTTQPGSTITVNEQGEPRT